MGIHDGHRKRMRERFQKYDLDSFDSVGALEFLLSFAIPRRDTNVIAHELINAFGSLPKVFEASEQELLSIPGIGKNAAALIRLVPQIMKKSEIEKAGTPTKIKSYRDAGQYLIPRYMGERNEILKLLCLDSHNRIICCEDVNEGVVNDVEVNVRRIAEIALKNKASALIIAHNHPDGILLVSKEDEQTTRALVTAMEPLGIPIIDHIIICGERVMSFSAMGAYPIFSRGY